MMKIVNVVLNVLRWYIAFWCLLFCLFSSFNSGTVLLLAAAFLMLPLRWIYELWQKVHLGNRYLKFGLLALMVIVGICVQSSQMIADIQVDTEPMTLTIAPVRTTSAEKKNEETTTAVNTTILLTTTTTTVTTTPTETTTKRITETTTTTTIPQTTTVMTTRTSPVTTKIAETTKVQTIKTTKAKPETQKKTTVAEEENNETLVWVTKSGKKYHSHNGCGTTDSKNARQIPLSEAQKKYTPCGKCY